MSRFDLRFSRSVPALLAAGLIVSSSLSGCTPTIKVAAPTEPITVNLNVKIQHEIYVKVDKDVDELFGEKGLF